LSTASANKLMSGMGGLKVETVEEEEIEHLHDHSHHAHSDHAEEENINIRAAVVHVIGDML